jgi:hypothetical protein
MSTLAGEPDAGDDEALMKDIPPLEKGRIGGGSRAVNPRGTPAITRKVICGMLFRREFPGKRSCKN